MMNAVSAMYSSLVLAFVAAGVAAEGKTRVPGPADIPPFVASSRGETMFGYATHLNADDLEWAGHFDVYVCANRLPADQVDALRKAGTKLILYDWANGFYLQESEKRNASLWNTDVWANHPEWILNRDNPGKGSFAPSYWYDMAEPGIRAFRIDLLTKRFEEWRYEGVFFDVPGFAVLPDSKELDLKTEYKKRHPDKDYDKEAGDFYRKLREKNPDKIIFMNQSVGFAAISFPLAEMELTESAMASTSGKLDIKVSLEDGRVVTLGQTDYPDAGDAINYCESLDRVRGRHNPKIQFVHLNRIFPFLETTGKTVSGGEKERPVFRKVVDSQAICYAQAIAKLFNHQQYCQPFCESPGASSEDWDMKFAKDAVFFVNLGKPVSSGFVRLGRKEAANPVYYLSWNSTNETSPFGAERCAGTEPGSRPLVLNRVAGGAPVDVFTPVALNQKEAVPFVLRAKVKGENVSDKSDRDHSIYCDMVYDDGSHWWGEVLPYPQGTYGWTVIERIMYPARPVKSIGMHLLMRGENTGKVMFDSISVGRLAPDFRQGCYVRAYEKGFVVVNPMKIPQAITVAGLAPKGIYGIWDAFTGRVITDLSRELVVTNGYYPADGDKQPAGRVYAYVKAAATKSAPEMDHLRFSRSILKHLRDASLVGAEDFSRLDKQYAALDGSLQKARQSAAEQQPANRSKHAAAIAALAAEVRKIKTVLPWQEEIWRSLDRAIVACGKSSASK